IFIAIERRAEDPLLRLELFRGRMFRATTVFGLFAGTAMFGCVTFVPLFAQAVIGTRATEAGATLMPFMLSWVVASTASAHLALRLGYRVMAVGGMVALTCGAGILSALGGDA